MTINIASQRKIINDADGRKTLHPKFIALKKGAKPKKKKEKYSAKENWFSLSRAHAFSG